MLLRAFKSPNIPRNWLWMLASMAPLLCILYVLFFVRRCCWPWVFLLGFFASLFCYKTILQNNNFLYRSNPIFSQLPGDHNCGSNAILTTLYEVEWPIIDINIVKKHNTTTHATPFQLLWFISTCSSLLIGCSIPLSNLFLFFLLWEFSPPYYTPEINQLQYLYQA